MASPLVLAPMAGITDHHFRLLVRRLGGVGLVTMEFLSADGVVKGMEQFTRKMRFVPEERPLSVQIYGRDAGSMAECAAVVNELGVDACDINMGCPANKILKGCAGAALMGDLAKAKEIIRACRSALSIPLTVKFRLGLGRRDDDLNYLELGRICEDLGVDAVALHGRSAKQRYTGRADWGPIRQLSETLSIPVIGNGDVMEPGDAGRMLSETGCAGVMIGRGVMHDPWIFRRSWQSLRGEDAPAPSLEERYAIIRTHFAWIVRDEPETLALHKLRTFLGRYTHGLPGGRELRRRIHALRSCEDFLEALDGHFEGLGLDTSRVAVA